MRRAFIDSIGGGNETPSTAKDLDASKTVFMACGLTPERASTLRAELDRNKVVSVEISMDDAVAAMFRYRKAVA
jgi:hypothetical protein